MIYPQCHGAVDEQAAVCSRCGADMLMVDARAALDDLPR